MDDDEEDDDGDNVDDGCDCGGYCDVMVMVLVSTSITVLRMAMCSQGLREFTFSLGVLITSILQTLF